MTPLIFLVIPGHSPPADSLAGFVPPSPLPDPVAGIFRFFFNVPQWIQIAGFFLGIAVAIWIAVHLVRRRRAIASWIRSRSRTIQWALALVVAIIVGGAAFSGERTWNYMQHDNDFCTSCHVMESPFQRFTVSAHHQLSCHDCHQQSIFASARQMVLWVAQRPEEIPDHAPVPNARCENCHVTGEKESWRRIRETAGHKIHLESKNPALAKVQCVTCHGVEVHRFTPVDATCGTMGCHDGVSIQLAKMSNQTSLHCVACHRFAAEIEAPGDSAAAARTIGPRIGQCNTCHSMQALIADFDPARDPHRGECGTCHNPHTQREAKEAGLKCASCHDNWKNEPFHTGPAHAPVAQNCTLCHTPHSARVDASNCTGCHRAIAERPGTDPKISRKLKAALPLEVSAASAAEQAPPPPHSISVSGVSFSHSLHSEMPCLRCHDPASTHGVVSFAIPAGCDACHHGSVANAAGCARCHSPSEIDAPREVTIAVAVKDHAPRKRAARFDHSDHSELECNDCHGSDITRHVRTEAASCVACHDDHHAANRTCSECHPSAQAASAHEKSGRDPHVACDSCHDPKTIATLMPDRSFCLTCHTNQATHYASGDRSCTSCHFLSRPEEFRAKLTSTMP